MSIIKLFHASTSNCQTRLGTKGLTVKQSDIYLADKIRPLQNDTSTQGSVRSSTSNNQQEEEFENVFNYDKHASKKNNRISFLHDKDNIWMQVTLTSNGKNVTEVPMIIM